MVDSPPRAVYSTITRGRGAQTAGHAAPAPATDIKVRFADPHSPRRRPTNENTGGPVREYFPKGTDFNSVTDAQVQAARGRLNRRPREVLNGQTPTEILDTIINGATTIPPPTPPRLKLHFRGRNARPGVRGAAAPGAAVREIVG